MRWDVVIDAGVMSVVRLQKVLLGFCNYYLFGSRDLTACMLC